MGGAPTLTFHKSSATLRKSDLTCCKPDATSRKSRLQQNRHLVAARTLLALAQQAMTQCVMTGPSLYAAEPRNMLAAWHLTAGVSCGTLTLSGPVGPEGTRHADHHPRLVLDAPLRHRARVPCRSRVTAVGAAAHRANDCVPPSEAHTRSYPRNRQPQRENRMARSARAACIKSGQPTPFAVRMWPGRPVFGRGNDHTC